MTILEIIAAADTSCNNWIGEMRSGKIHAILNFTDYVACGATKLQLEEAGAEVTVTTSPYGEKILLAIWTP